MEVTTGEEGQCPGRAGPGAEVARSRTAVCLLRVWERARALTMAVPPATTPRPPPRVHRTDSSPDARVRNVELNETHVLEVGGAGDPLVGDHARQEGPLL